MNIDAKKAAFAQWIRAYFAWEEGSAEHDSSAIAQKAAEIFGEPYSKTIRREANGEMSKLQREVLDIMSNGNWYTDYDLAALIGKSEATAGARRRDLRKFGYTVVSESNGGLWRHRIVFDPIPPAQ